MTTDAQPEHDDELPNWEVAPDPDPVRTWLRQLMAERTDKPAPAIFTRHRKDT